MFLRLVVRNWSVSVHRVGRVDGSGRGCQKIVYSLYSCFARASNNNNNAQYRERRHVASQSEIVSSCSEAYSRTVRMSRTSSHKLLEIERNRYGGARCSHKTSREAHTCIPHKTQPTRATFPTFRFSAITIRGLVSRGVYPLAGYG